MRFNDLRLSKKLSFGFGAVLMVVAGSSSFLVFKVIESKEIQRLNSVSDNAVDLIDQSNADLANANAAIRSFILTGADSDDAAFQANRAELV